jgi:cbb3-type cytochrome oxidase subunit 3
MRRCFNLRGVIMALAVGFIFFIGGAFGLYWTGKRAFYRRNSAGIQEFNSYSGALVTNALESIVRIGSLTGIVLGVMMISMWFMFGR